MIEQSFGPFQDPDDHEVIINEKSFATGKKIRKKVEKIREIAFHKNKLHT